MAVKLTNMWNQHAFPDEMPGREERWSQESEQRRVEDRTDFNHEQSGSTSKIRRFTGGRDDTLSGKAARDKAEADDMMMLAASMQHANWNNPVTLTIGGQDLELTQGEWHDIARKYRQKVEQDIEQARARGASDAEMAVLLQRRESADQFVAQTGKEDWSDEDRQAIMDGIAANDHMRDFVLTEARSRGEPTCTGTPDADIAARANNSTATGEETIQEIMAGSISAASTFQDEPFAHVTVSPTEDFAMAAADTPDASPVPAVEPDEPDQGAPRQNSGFSPG